MRIKSFFFICFFIVLLTISCFAEAPIILSQPQNVYLPSNVQFPITVQFAILATGDDLSYQWQTRGVNGSWQNTGATGANSPILNWSVQDNNVNGQRIIRCVVSNNDGTVISEAVSVSVSAYILDSIPQLLSWSNEVVKSIFDWVGQSCTYIVSEPFLLFTVGFLAVGACIALLSRLLARS